MKKAFQNNTPLVAVLPTSLTLANAVCGFAAISYATDGEAEGAIIEPVAFAGLLILLAMVFDALDGSAARLTRQTSAFGAYLDSLCDVVSFGVAPAVLIVNFPHVIPSRLLWCIALSYVLCATLRLARFNVDHEEGGGSDVFCGLPSPAAAGVVASLVLVWPSLQRWAGGEAPAELQPAAAALAYLTPAGMPWLALVLACLMVSKIRYPHPLRQFLQGKRPLIHLVQAYFILVAAFAVHEVALPLAFFVFALGSPLRALISQLTAGIARSKLLAFIPGD